MKILILNWRDVKNPSSGGAEILTQEIAKRWVKLGHEVTQFSSFFAGCKKEETIDGVKIIRRGRPDVRYFFTSVHFLAFSYYKREARGKFDVVIDEVHGIPFFTPWYVKEKKVVLICEVAGSLWVRIFGKFFGTLGIITEKFYLRYIYTNIPYFTISESTKKDLIRNGIKENCITVLPMGINVTGDVKSEKKEGELTLIFVGRLMRTKGIEDTLFALKEIHKHNPRAKLWIVGKGDKKYEAFLKKMTEDLDISYHVDFFGFVSEKKKFDLLSRSHFLIHPSVHEGFGLTIPEAGYVGTPVIAYNSSGLRDIVKNNKNGILLSRNSPEILARETLRVSQDVALYGLLCKGAKEEAKQYNWDRTAKVALSGL